VLENLQMGAVVAGGSDFDADCRKMFKLFPRLEQRLHQRGGTLSGGEQQMLAIARALMARPRLLLLDEPSLGLAPQLVEQIFEELAALRDSGRTLLLVDQNAELSLAIADRGYVLERGRVTAQGPAADLRADGALVEAYLGGPRPVSIPAIVFAAREEPAS
jgi:branched-chain amino acid transport system ATP-binding protein